MSGKSKVTIKDKGLNALLKRLKDEKWTLTVGVHGAEGSAKEETSGGKLTVLDVATVNEYGLGVPERSFIRSWADETETTNAASLRKIAKTVLAGKYDIKTGLTRLGLRFVAQIQARIVAHIAPENAESTIAKKKSSTPLVNTGQLKASILSKVSSGGDP